MVRLLLPFVVSVMMRCDPLVDAHVLGQMSCRAVPSHALMWASWYTSDVPSIEDLI